MTRRSWIIVFLILIAPFTLTVSAQDEQPEPTRIILWHAFGGDVLPILDRMLADFNQTHPGIIAEAEPQGGYEDTFSALESRVEEAANFQPSADDENATAPPVPHLVHVTTIDARRAVASGLFEPLADIPDGYYDTLLQSYAFDGAQYGIPWNSSLPVLYANVDLLAEADVTGLPTTFAAFTDACESLGGGCSTWAIDAWIVHNWTGGAALDSLTFGSFAMWWADMAASGHYVSNRRLADWDDALSRFQSGEVAFLVASTADVQSIDQQADFEFQSGPLPDAPEGFVPQGGALWMIAGHSPEEQTAAQTLLAWLTNTENVVRWYKGTGFLPTRSLAYVILTEQGLLEAQPTLTIAVDAFVNQAYVVTMDTRETNQIIEEGMLRIITGTPVEREVANMQDRITRVIEE